MTRKQRWRPIEPRRHYGDWLALLIALSILAYVGISIGAIR